MLERELISHEEVKGDFEVEIDPVSVEKFNLSAQNMAQTAYPELLSKFSDLLDGNSDIPLEEAFFTFKDEIEVPEDCYSVGLFWRTRKNEEMDEINGFMVKAFSNGTIFVDSGQFGSSVLLKDEWKEREEVQEESVRKAIRFPRLVGTIEPDEGEWPLQKYKH